MCSIIFGIIVTLNLQNEFQFVLSFNVLRLMWVIFWFHRRARDQLSSLGKVGSGFTLKGKYDFSGIESWGKHSRPAENSLSQDLEGEAWNRRQREQILEIKYSFILRYLRMER